MVPPLHVLEDNGVRIETDHRNITPLPQYVEELRELLLNFKEIIPLMQKFSLGELCKADQHLASNDFSLDSDIYHDPSHRAYQTRWAAADDLRSKSKMLMGRDREENWKNLFSGYVFENINLQSSQWVLSNTLHNFFRGSEDVFTNAVRIRGMLSDDNQHQPKPDYWFGLGLYDDKQLSRLKGLELSDPGIEYFTQESLRTLRDKYPQTFIHQPVSTRKGAGFPWMVVEIKKENGNEQECLRQIANCCHTTIMFYERLLKFTPRDKALEANKPPTVALTAVGPKVNIFVAYRSRRRRGGGYFYRMSSIWNGNLQHILHAVQLRRIVDQLMIWALRIFKPWVTSCLDRWYQQASAEDSEEEETENEDSDGDRESVPEENRNSDGERDTASDGRNSDFENSDTDQTTPPSTPHRR